MIRKKNFLMGVVLFGAVMHAQAEVVAAAHEVSEAPAASSVAVPVDEGMSIPVLDERAIELHKEMIGGDFAANVHHRLAFKVALAGVAGYMVYDHFFAKPGIKHEVRAGDLWNREEAIKRIDTVLQAQYPDAFTLPWFKSWGKTIGGGFVALVATHRLADITNTALDGVFHDGSLNWYSTTQTQCLATLKECVEYAQQLNQLNAATQQSECAHCKQQLIFVGKALVRDIEKVLGFMHYKVAQMSANPANATAEREGKALIGYITTITNDFAARLNNALREDRKQSTLMPTVMRFMAEFARAQASFNRLESTLVE